MVLILSGRKIILNATILDARVENDDITTKIVTLFPFFIIKYETTDKTIAITASTIKHDHAIAYSSGSKKFAYVTLEKNNMLKIVYIIIIKHK